MIMAQRMEITYHKKPCYDIVFTQDFEELREELKELGCENRKLCIVTDSTVETLYCKEVLAIAGSVSKNPFPLSFRQEKKTKIWIR